MVVGSHLKRVSHLYLDIGGVLLTNGWDSHYRKQEALKFKLDWAEMGALHRLLHKVESVTKLALLSKFDDFRAGSVFREIDHMGYHSAY